MTAAFEFSAVDPVVIPDGTSPLNAAFRQYVHLKTGSILMLLWNADARHNGGGWFWRVENKFCKKNLPKHRLEPDSIMPKLTKEIVNDALKWCM